MATAYVWELGIDLNALVGPANASYMPGGFTLPGDPSPVRRPVVLHGDTISFRIFDLTKDNLQVITMQSFTVNPRPAVQQANVAPLKLQPSIITNPPPNTNPPLQSSTYFGTPSGLFPCWESQPVSVDQAATDKKFLLNFFVQVIGAKDGPRTFVHDPEMIVGPNM